MDRRDFIRKSVVGVTVAGLVPASIFAKCDAGASGTGKKTGDVKMNISFQEGTAPGETLADRFDFMEANGVRGFEPGGRGLAGRVPEIKELLKGRDIQVTAICAGFEGFILAEDDQKPLFDKTMKEIIVAAGELGSCGVIMVPAFNRQTPCMPHTQATRDYLVEQLAELGNFALEYGTTIILEPLNRREAFYLRQVADAASMCRDANSAGVKCMGDFWHMTWEETCDYGAFYSAGEYLQHVHIASRARRVMPGEDGEADVYTDGFRALKQMGYEGWISFECGTKGDKQQTVTEALSLIRSQWDAV